MRCPTCSGDDCVQIEIHLKDEETVEFFSCRRCEARWWEREGDTLTLTEVLDLATRKESK